MSEIKMELIGLDWITSAVWRNHQKIVFKKSAQQPR